MGHEGMFQLWGCGGGRGGWKCSLSQTNYGTTAIHGAKNLLRHTVNICELGYVVAQIKKLKRTGAPTWVAQLVEPDHLISALYFG